MFLAAFNRFWTDQVKAINELAGPALRQWAKDWGFASEIILDSFRKMTRWLGGELYNNWSAFKNLVSGTVAEIRKSPLALISDIAESAVASGMDPADANALANASIQRNPSLWPASKNEPRGQPFLANLF